MTSFDHKYLRVKENADGSLEPIDLSDKEPNGFKEFSKKADASMYILTKGDYSKPLNKSYSAVTERDSSDKHRLLFVSPRVLCDKFTS